MIDRLEKGLAECAWWLLIFVIEKIYRGTAPFMFDPIVYSRDSVLDFGGKLPKEISLSELV